MSASQPYKSRGGIVAHWMNRLVRQFGFVLLPISEIERMELDAKQDYESMRAIDGFTLTKSYFNGLADYSSKKAHQFRERYLPNEKVSHCEPEAPCGSSKTNL